MQKFSEFWAHTGWKMAYAGIVVVAVTMMIVIFGQEVRIMDAVISITVWVAIIVGGWYLIRMGAKQEFSCL